LRERVEDIPALVDHFLSIFALRYRRDRKVLAKDATKRLLGYSWPGNVRQLENVLLNAWLMSEGHEIEGEDLNLPDAPARRQASVAAEAVAVPRPSLLPGSATDYKEREKERILGALQASNWNRVRAAEMLGVPRRTFYRRLKEFGIQ
jgi:DNA-binding NtrC family response regulator